MRIPDQVSLKEYAIFGLMTSKTQSAYRAQLQRSVDYLESCLFGEVSVPKAASIACYSIFHFQRIFVGLVGMTVMEYVRRRRLSEAAKRLVNTDQTILRIAIDLGYEAHESFSRAFKREFGIAPKQYRAQRNETILLEPLNLKTHWNMKKTHQPEIVHFETMKIIGVGITTNPERNQQEQEIEKFWQRVDKECLFDSIPNPLDSNRRFGICKETYENGDFTYVIGREVSSLETIPQDMIGFTIPQAIYAQFVAQGPLPEAILKTWAYATGSWLPQSTYTHAGTPDFEMYDEQFTEKNQWYTHILVPIKEK